MIFGFFDNMRKADLPDSSEIVKIPSKLRNDAENLKCNSIKVRFFNQNFTKLIAESDGIVSYETAIPIVYFDKPAKLGVILFDDVTYTDMIRNVTCLDVCELYAYGIDKNSSLKKELDVQYYKDLKKKRLSSKSQELYYETNCGYYVPVLLNNIPIPIIQIKKEITNPVDGRKVLKIVEITQNLLRMLADVKMLQRVGKKDNSALYFCALLFFLLGGGISSLITLMIVL